MYCLLASTWPAKGPDTNLALVLENPFDAVISIRNLPKGQMQLSIVDHFLADDWFQSASNPRPDATRLNMILHLLSGLFQSASNPKARCNFRHAS